MLALGDGQRTAAVLYRGVAPGRPVGVVGAVGVAAPDEQQDRDGERWHARTAAPVTKGQALTVTEVDGLVLQVEPTGSKS